MKKIMPHVKCAGFIEDLYNILEREVRAARKLDPSPYRSGVLTGVESISNEVDRLVDANGWAQEE
jgi:hypothetical protein